MFKIRCNFQNYEWGNIGNSSRVFQLASQQGFECNETLPYAGINSSSNSFLFSHRILDGRLSRKECYDFPP